MKLSNKKRTTAIKRIYTLSMLAFILSAALCFWLDRQIWGFALCGLFLVGLSLMQFLQINYISYNSDENPLTIKYHSISSLFGNTYSSIDFNQEELYKLSIARFNRFADLTIYIQRQQGIFEYPAISLMGLSKSEIDEIEKDMQQIIDKNNGLWQTN